MHKIVIANASGFPKSYVIVMQAPVVSGKGAQPAVFTHAWVSFSSISDGSHAFITFSDRVFAYWTRAAEPLEGNIRVAYAGSALVDTARMESVSFVGHTPAGFEAPTACDVPASYRIVASNDFTKADRYLFGLAKSGQLPGVPSPVATFVAEPNESYDITPTSTFYVLDAACAVGDIVDQAIIAKACPLDFAQTTHMGAVVTQAPNGSLTATYF